MKKALFFLSVPLTLLLGCNSNGKVVSGEYVPGESYYGNNNYIEYIAGNLPIVIAVPHDGDLEPDFIPDRNCTGCKQGRDNHTLAITLGMRDIIYQKTGKYPHIIINRLHRRKMDANREIVEAANGDPIAERAWNDFHTFIENAKSIVQRDYGKGVFMDFHGHTHETERVELGYLMDDDELELSDFELSTLEHIESSSIRNLALSNPEGLRHAQLLRGEYSLGTLLQSYGFDSVPSEEIPHPFGAAFYSGGYNTREHGSRYGGTIDGVQVECNHEIRHNEVRRQAFITAIAESTITFMETHYFSSLSE